jgi:hypothetical protein
MPKITDQDYFLPEIALVAKKNEVLSGTTEPMIIRGICKKTFVKSDYVVKFKNGPRMSHLSLCNELVASFLAMELDLNVAQPAIIKIDQAFVDSLKGHRSYLNASKSLGLNFCCKYVTGYNQFNPEYKLSPVQKLKAYHIFSFDIFISNVDRRVDKPNMITDGEDIVIFDHELAFSFIYTIIQNPVPWLIPASEMHWIKNHYFYESLRGNEHSFDLFVDKLTTLDDNFWRKLYQLVPDEWQGEHIDKIKNNLSLLVQNRSIFKEELKKILS